MDADRLWGAARKINKICRDVRDECDQDDDFLCRRCPATNPGEGECPFQKIRGIANTIIQKTAREHGWLADQEIKINFEGDWWCASLGDGDSTGNAGFGLTPEEALKNLMIEIHGQT